ncbi:hypothetical protein GOODEAATRI_003242 [Goodea atripinnis]|uniref:Uncharacterized protein n=1 Tax=Goodea atripinnis TaxID=208336 RepID=A0ABV0NH53_9TELE
MHWCPYCPALSPFDLAKETVICNKVKSKFITIEGKENRSLWFGLRTSPLGHVSALASSSKACFLFGLFSGGILNRSGPVLQECGAPVAGLFFTFKQSKRHREDAPV